LYWLKNDGKFAHYGITDRGNAQWVGFHLTTTGADNKKEI
jgi:hypothetical protein